MTCRGEQGGAGAGERGEGTFGGWSQNPRNQAPPPPPAWGIGTRCCPWGSELRQLRPINSPDTEWPVVAARPAPCGLPRPLPRHGSGFCLTWSGVCHPNPKCRRRRQVARETWPAGSSRTSSQKPGGADRVPRKPWRALDTHGQSQSRGCRGRPETFSYAYFPLLWHNYLPSV